MRNNYKIEALPENVHTFYAIVSKIWLKKQQQTNSLTFQSCKIIHPDILNALLPNKSHIHFPITLQISQIHQQVVFVQDETVLYSWSVVMKMSDDKWQQQAKHQGDEGGL